MGCFECERICHLLSISSWVRKWRHCNNDMEQYLKRFPWHQHLCQHFVVGYIVPEDMLFQQHHPVEYWNGWKISLVYLRNSDLNPITKIGQIWGGPKYFLFKPACGELDILVKRALQCMCVHAWVFACIRPSVLIGLDHNLYVWMDFKIIWRNCSP